MTVATLRKKLITISNLWNSAIILGGIGLFLFLYTLFARFSLTKSCWQLIAAYSFGAIFSFGAMACCMAIHSLQKKTPSKHIVKEVHPPFRLAIIFFLVGTISSLNAILYVVFYK